MFKWLKLIRFIQKYRAKGLPHFEILTNGSEIIICAKDDGHNETLRIKHQHLLREKKNEKLRAS